VRDGSRRGAQRQRKRRTEKKFEVLNTIDKNIRHQQNISGRDIAILIIRAASNDIDDIRPHVPQALAALKTIKPGQILEVGIVAQ
jgi:hypothetical protein